MILKYSVGLDISAKEIHSCISSIDSEQTVKVIRSKKFANSLHGHKELATWMDTCCVLEEIPLVVTMEATGIYHESCALYLYENNYRVCIVLPNKAKKYIQAIGIKSKNDPIDARGLSQMGAEQNLELWKPMGKYFYQLRELTRQHQSIQELLTSVQNQLSAASRGMYLNEFVIQQLEQTVHLLKDQRNSLEKEISNHFQRNVEVAKKVENICSIKGVSILTVAVILAETNGFALFRNKRQLVSFAGYDVMESQSGSRVGRTKISKKGNGRIRRILHMPAFNVVRFEQTAFVKLYQRTLNKHNIKMKSYVAVQKKLLTTIYTLWKKNESYDNQYYTRNMGQKETASNNLEKNYKNSANNIVGTTQGSHTIIPVTV
ncbi:MAG TPA: transposase [Flavobacteriaceae bacterium]|nr:transposase [Flavobacteriaceae bacterium]